MYLIIDENSIHNFAKASKHALQQARKQLKCIIDVTVYCANLKHFNAQKINIKSNTW